MSEDTEPEVDTVTTIDAEAAAPVETPEPSTPTDADVPEDGPSVDQLQDRLGELQSAMDQLQSGDLDGAEATIASLEQALADARQESGLT